MPVKPLNPIASKPTIYTTIIVKLQDLLIDITEVKVATSIEQIIKKIKIAFEDHIQSILKIKDELQQLKNLTRAQLTKINEIIKLVDLSEEVKPSETERFDNYSRRRFESDLALNLLFSPTDSMMHSVQRVSHRYILLIEQNRPECFELALRECGPTSSFAEVFGRFDHTPTLNEVITLLRENSKENLPKIFLLHYLLWWSWQHSGTEFSIKLPKWEHQPNGQFANYLKSRLQEHDLPQDDFEHFRDLIHENICELGYFCNIHMYKSEMYANRGRRSVTQSRSNCVGLLLADHDRGELQRFSDGKQLLTWGSDALMVTADFAAPYVKNIFSQDGVYISGASGMATFYLSLMEMLGNFQDVYAKQNYLAAYSAYIVAGGLHSFHEVFLPSQHFLKLIPGYNAELTTADNNYQTRPANYSAFFDIFANNPQFNALHEKTWGIYLADYRKRTSVSDLKQNSMFAPARPQMIEEDIQREAASSLNISAPIIRRL